MIFVKENFSFLYTTDSIGVYDYEQLREDFDFHNIVKANMLLLKNNNIFLYFKFKNEIGLESESYYHIVPDNKNDYEKIKKFIHSNIMMSYDMCNEKQFNEYMEKLYPEFEGIYIYGNFIKKLREFDKVVEYNWEYFKVSDRVKLVKYALGLDYQEDDNFSNKIYSEIKSRFKNRETNSFEIPSKFYEDFGDIIKDGAKKVYENFYIQDWEEYNKWYAQEILGIWSKEENMVKGNKDNMEELDEKLIEYLENCRRAEAHILTPKIESIYANKEKRTIAVKWKTGETTKVTCHESDTWDLEKGIMACITKYVLGNNYNAGSILNKYIASVKYSDNK